MLNPAGWGVSDSKDNAVAKAEAVAIAGRQHIVYSATAGYSAVNVGKTLTIRVGNDVVWLTYIHDTGVYEFSRGIAAPPGVAVTAELEASGMSGVVGAVSLHGVTI